MRGDAEVLPHGSRPYRRSNAGIAEAVICVALLAGDAVLRRRGASGRLVAVAPLAFAVLGFVVGLGFTIRGGAAIDVAYHAALLPLLLGTLILAAASGRADRSAARRR